MHAEYAPINSNSSLPCIHAILSKTCKMPLFRTTPPTGKQGRTIKQSMQLYTFEQTSLNRLKITPKDLNLFAPQYIQATPPDPNHHCASPNFHHSSTISPYSECSHINCGIFNSPNFSATPSKTMHCAQQPHATAEQQHKATRLVTVRLSRTLSSPSRIPVRACNQVAHRPRLRAAVHRRLRGRRHRPRQRARVHRSLGGEQAHRRYRGGLRHGFLPFVLLMMLGLVLVMLLPQLALWLLQSMMNAH